MITPFLLTVVTSGSTTPLTATRTMFKGSVRYKSGTSITIAAASGSVVMASGSPDLRFDMPVDLNTITSNGVGSVECVGVTDNSWSP